MISSDKQMSPARVARKHPLRCLLAGLRFLTIFPTFSSAENDSDYLAGALYFFCIIGIALGSLAAVLFSLFFSALPALVGAALLAILLSLFSGFLHLDGLADTADGFLSGKPVDICLDIMRDSRIGVMGAAAVCGLFLLKTAALSSISGQELLFALVLAPAAGRTAILCLMSVLPYVRKENGLASLFYTGSTRSAATLSLLLLLLLTAFLTPEKLILLGVTTSLVIGCFAFLCKKRIGGATGDTLGALCEITETAVLIAFTLFI